MSKKLTAMLLCVVLMCSFSTVAYAQNPAVITPDELVQTESDIMPCFEYTNTTATSLSISTSGTATCTARLNGYNGITTKIDIKMTLQKKTLLWWSEVDSWSTTINNSYGALTKTASVGSGKYRVKVDFTVYSGSNSEKITTYSQEKEF